jgi:hypothetical protein
MIVLVNVISLAKSVFCKFKKSLNNIKKKSTCFRKCSCYTYVILIVRKFFELQEWFCNELLSAYGREKKV